ncbi:hypothetical protein BX666DRAFT_1063248 [Dichotomocladium elegans]|nr:hypothetical protein BX666DRAFT_1063248 [Dichotomocladium elegans]
MTSTPASSSVKPSTKTIRTLIKTHLEGYSKAANVEPGQHPNMSQVAAYVSTEIMTAYKINVQQRFGECLRRVVNSLLNVRQRKEAIRKEMVSSDEHEFRQVCEERIWKPARQIKEPLRRRNPDHSNLTPEAHLILAELSPILQAYDDTYKFAKDDIYYDVKKSPGKHLNAFYQLCKFLGMREAKSVQCFPLWTSWIPCHIHIHTRILCQHISRQASTKDPPIEKTWGKVLDLKSKAFKDRHDRRFFGAIQTDGVSVSIILKTPEAKKNLNRKRTRTDTGDIITDDSALEPECLRIADSMRNKGARRDQSKNDHSADCSYIHDIPHDELQETEGKCLLIDPGRRDLHYGMHELSTPELPKIHQYTRNQRARETQMVRFRQIRDTGKDRYDNKNSIREAETRLAQICHSIVNAARYKLYVESRAREWSLLSSFYSRTTTTYTTSTHPVHNKYGPAKSDWGKRRARKMHPYVDHEAHNHPLHWKLRLSAYINQKQADARLVRTLRRRFGKDTVLVMGNWSAPITRFHEPIRGKGWRDIFKRHGFKVYLIDEYRTSVTCPECSDRLETFKRIPNPRPWQRIKRPEIKCHGLLRCTNLNCSKSMEFSRSRLWNRDTAAVLNFRHILLSLRTNGEIPERFRHPKATAAAADNKNFPALLSQD